MTSGDLGFEIVFTRHASTRLHERAPGVDLDTARDEIAAAILSRSYEKRKRNIWVVHGRKRSYPLADCGSNLIVLTVLDREMVQAA